MRAFAVVPSSSELPAQGEGRSGGFRTVTAYRSGDRAVFLYGFAKSGQANISNADERDLQDYGKMILDLDDRGIATMIAGNELKEVISNA